MRTSRFSRSLKTTTALSSILVLSLAAATGAAANPKGGEVVAGEATISAPDATTLLINQSSQNAVVNWHSFNIGHGETTRFVQPNRDAWILNRVNGPAAPSQILGTLEANGNVAVVNPDGILFGKDARVDVGGLIATTHDIANGDFMAGRFNFNLPGNPSASVVNEGDISIADYGLAAFVAPGVRNAGTITARLGRVGLASANGFSLDLYGDNLINLTVGDEILDEVVDVATGKPVADLVKNEGTITADGGTVALTAATARRAVNSVVNNTGVIEAKSVGMKGGKIVLGGQTAATKTASAPVQKVKVSGKLVATHIPIPTPRPDPAGGGHIAVTGEMIEVAGATIDASGEGKGGTVLVGGDYMGGHAEDAALASLGIAREAAPVPTASYVALDADTTIRADGLGNGDGGKVVVWSDEATVTAATITARGGTESGDGGFVEVSANERLAFDSVVDVGAPAGASGTLLLDPTDVTIGTTGDWIITPAAIQTALASGNVIVTTSEGGGNGDLTVAQSLHWTNANRLTLSAYRHINVNASITNSGAADISLRADKTGTGVGTVIFAPGTQISTAGTVSVYYNPSVNPAGSGVNDTSYLSPMENFSAHLDGLTNETFMLVNSVYDLQNVDNNLSASYALGRDIDASETVGWEGSNPYHTNLNYNGFSPIGRNSDRSFRGVFDGDGHTINGINIIYDLDSGLFQEIGIGGIVRNLIVSNARFSQSDLTGGVVGEAFIHDVGIISGLNSGTIYNVRTSGNLNVTGVGGIGGISGSNFGNIYDSSSDINILISGGNSFCENCGPDGPQEVLYFGFAGGLVGYNYGTIKRSFATGSISISPSPEFRCTSCGGAGFAFANYGSITDSYSGVSVYGSLNDEISAFVYRNGESLYFGTIGTISSSYAYGSVTNAESAGFVHTNDSSRIDAITNSYWDVESTGQQVSAAGIGLTTAQLKSDLPAGFDPAIWAIDPDINDGYPHLRQAVTSVTPPVVPPVTPPVTPPAFTLAVDPFSSTSLAASAPGYHPAIPVTGSGFSNVTQIVWTWTAPSGKTAGGKSTDTITWTPADWAGKVQILSDGQMILSPVLIAANDPTGLWHWTVTIVAGAQQITRDFTVDYKQGATPSDPASLVPTGNFPPQAILLPPITMANSTDPYAKWIEDSNATQPNRHLETKQGQIPYQAAQGPESDGFKVGLADGSKVLDEFNVGTKAGTLMVTTPDGRRVKVESLGAGPNYGTTDGDPKYQCVYLIKKYGVELQVFDSTDLGLGDAWGVAEKFAEIADGFDYVSAESNVSRNQLPKDGAVLSISGWGNLKEGHVGIVAGHTWNDDGTYSVILFDQNWSSNKWKTVTFAEVGGKWVGSMPNTPKSTNVTIYLDVEGWANPT